MMSRTPKVEDFEGLVYTTARRYSDALADEDFEDIRQILRTKVWQALERYDAHRSAKSVQEYVFGCVANQVKDLLKAQSRRNRARGGALLHLEDLENFEPQIAEERALAAVEDQMPLPPGLTRIERQLALLLVAGHSLTDAAEALGVSRSTARRARAGLQSKIPAVLAA